MKKLLLKNKVVIISSVIVLILVLIGIYFLPKSKSSAPTAISFLNTNNKLADSLLATLTTEQKLAQIFITTTSNPSLQNSKTNGGIFINANNLDEYKNLYNQNVTRNTLSPFVCKNTELFVPDFFSQYFDLPSFEAVMSVRDSNFLTELLEFTTRQDSIFGINYNFYSLIEKVSDSINYDKNLISTYQNITNQLVISSLNRKTLVGIPYIKIPQTNAFLNKIWTNFYKQLVKLGLPSLILDNDADAQKIAEKLNFDGIFITKNLRKNHFEEFLASNFDAIMIDSLSEKTFKELTQIVNKKGKYKKMLNQKVRKIILAKIWLSQKNNWYRNIKITENEIVNRKNKIFFREIIKKSSILLKNDENIIPFSNVNSKYECFVFGEKPMPEFEKIIKKYAPAKLKFLNKNTNIIHKLKINKNANIIIVLNDIEIDENFIKHIKNYDTTHNLVVVNFENLASLRQLANTKHLLHVWQNDEVSQSYAAQILFGGIGAKAKLPFVISDSLPFDQGYFTNKIRLSYDIAEMVGLDSKKLTAIDSIINSGIASYAFPGCQIFVAKNGVVVSEKSYGYHTYSKSQKVQNTDIYDIASITKIASTTLAAMKLNEQNKLPLDVEIGEYFNNKEIEYDRIKPDTTIKIDTIHLNEEPDFEENAKDLYIKHLNDSILVAYDTAIYKSTPKNNIFKVTPRLMLEHKSGIQPALPILKLMLLDNDFFIRIRDIYDETLDSLAQTPTFLEKYNEIYVDKYIRDSAETEVAAGMFMKKEYEDTLWRDIKALPVWKKKEYIYSDVNMVILKIVIDSINHKGINNFNYEKFYKPLGFKCLTFNPLKNYKRNKIIPTEKDSFWRRQLLRGHVHDPSAALLGGIAGNAGLFSNAIELGILGQMLINGGTYGGQRFLLSETIKLFTETQPDTHRGLGFDKWSKRQIIAQDASPNTFGHTGFTGTCMWLDPDNEIVFIFLSNRVHPSAKNWKINSLKIRQKVHQAVYDARVE